MKLLTYFLCLAALIQACASLRTSSTVTKPAIVDKPIIFDDERTELSLAYMRDHYGLASNSAVIDPRMVVVHWTAIPTLEGSYRAFYASRLPSSRKAIKNASALNVSVPYLIDRDGTIYQLMPDTLFARHVIGLNHTAIGIENVGDGDKYPLTEEQYQANKSLITYLADKYDIEYVIGHHEYKRFRNHPLWLEKDPNYLTKKSDPGDTFMKRLRNDLKSLPLKPLPTMEGQSNIRQGVKGQVRWLQGNMMPTIGEGVTTPRPQPKGIERTIHIYELTRQSDAKYENGFFSNFTTSLVKKVDTDEQGHFTVGLPPGDYSLLVAEEQGLYASFFDGQGHLQPVEVKLDSMSLVDIVVDYKAAY